MKDRLDTQPVMAHGLGPGALVRRTHSETPWRIQSVSPDPRALDRVVISGENGRVVVADLSQWFQRVIER